MAEIHVGVVIASYISFLRRVGDKVCMSYLKDTSENLDSFGDTSIIMFPFLHLHS
jgi:hypothetical protein